MYVDVVAGFNAQVRFYDLGMMVSAAVTIGFVPGASYAYGAGRYRRILREFIHAGWICGWTWAAL
jgi:Na+-driven multidrug efflux pump